MDQPLVSVITPVLNRATSIRTCLASVARQTYPRIEHIVVDGGSTDGTQETLRSHHPPHSFHWISESDNGMYEAINKGLALAHGDILAYLNSDDLYLPWSVDVAVRALQHDIELIFGDLGIVVNDADGRPDSFYVQFYPDFDLRHYSFVGTIGQPTVFWRRGLTDRIGCFDTQYRLIGDCEYWLRAALSGAKVRHLQELMAIQVEHSSTLRATEAVRLGEEFETLRRAMRTWVDPPPSLVWERSKRSALWRARQLQFFWAMRTKHPSMWLHFVGALRAHGVNVHLSDLRVLAPARWRGNASLFGDARSVYQILSPLGQ